MAAALELQQTQVQVGNASNAIGTPSIVARLVHAFAMQGHGILPASSCIVRPIAAGDATSTSHLLVFDVGIEGRRGVPDRLVLKYAPRSEDGQTREALSYTSICPLIDPSTAMFPRIWACYNGPMGQALLLEAVEREPLPVPWIAQEPAKAGAEATHLLKHPTPKQLSLPIPPIDPSRLPPSSSPAPQETIKVPPTSPLSPAPSADEEEELEPPPYGAEDCFAALRALARLHAPFLGNDSLLDTLSSAHPFLTSDFTDSASAPSLSSRDADHLRERYAALPTSLIPTKEREWLYALIADAPSWREDCSSALASTLLHGDAHMANFLSQSNDIVILCSPQFAIGPPTLDLAYFLTALWASCLGAPPIDAAQALEAYLTELARLGVAWLRSESEEDLTAKAELLGRCVQLEAAVTILWRTIEYLERTPDIASERIDAVLNHLRDLEPRCRETSALLAHRAEKEERQEHAVV